MWLGTDEDEQRGRLDLLGASGRRVAQREVFEVSGAAGTGDLCVEADGDGRRRVDA
jgi:hypothetical protein